MADFARQFYPGKRVEVLMSAEIGSYWLRGTVTEPRDQSHKGKIRVWLDQKPSGWQTFEVIFPMAAVVESLIRPLNQPDRIITFYRELGDIFYFSAPVSVLVADEVKSEEGFVTKPSTDEFQGIEIRFLKSRKKVSFSCAELSESAIPIRRIYSEKKPKIGSLYLA